MRQQPLVLGQYDEIITKQLHDGIIEEINPHNDSPEPGKVHYLSHHPVIREHAKTTKVRIVYDASAKVRNDPIIESVLENRAVINSHDLLYLITIKMESSCCDCRHKKCISHD